MNVGLIDWMFFFGVDVMVDWNFPQIDGRLAGSYTLNFKHTKIIIVYTVKHYYLILAVDDNYRGGVYPSRDDFWCWNVRLKLSFLRFLFTTLFFYRLWFQLGSFNLVVQFLTSLPSDEGQPAIQSSPSQLTAVLAAGWETFGECHISDVLQL